MLIRGATAAVGAAFGLACVGAMAMSHAAHVVVGSVRGTRPRADRWERWERIFEGA